MMRFLRVVFSLPKNCFFGLSGAFSSWFRFRLPSFAFVQAVDAQKAKAQKSLEKAEILYKALMQEYLG